MIKRLVLDVLIPIKGPSIVDIAENLSRVKGVNAVNITVKEVDVETQNIIVVIEGDNIDFGETRVLIEELGGVIHSVDQVVAGKKIVGVPREIYEEL
ncbi:DUF211 domain-containing protein [Staphylothermus hellenicus]|uniref:DUF211 domain-containing protein n=1 Tax=Staphylothermus hellenicus (strain DSM 12710 / JCM 10830 / BK20S6-10-b1 / P8) TaxID=591019 RepID=D7DC84_STAHD|nr:DUF211 domain-containing protein [Staphylothermus hellenicus]ADI31781.1 protein of unknown function DUF211 [Staphylothermus hellenicus DSM 12710]